MTNFDERGEPLPVPEKYVNTQCRLIWWFSTLHRRFPEMPKAAEMARQGVEFLIKHFWDEQYGGFYWKVKRDGRELDSAKIVYGESYCIYALSEYYRATGDKIGLEYAGRTFDLLQKYCADTEWGGYLENVNRDWSAEAGGFAGGDRKGLDTHMHLMESFTTLYAASGEEIHGRKLQQVVDLIREKMIDKATGCGLNQFDLAFHSLPAISIKRTWNGERLGEQPADPVDTTSYGHNVELEYLMHQAMTAVGNGDASYLPIYRRLLDHAVENGVDWEYGGIYRDGLRATGKAIVFEKEFWQHSEALAAFLDGYEQFREPRYLDAFGKVWGFVREQMIIKEVGEWRTLLDRYGKAIDAKIGNPWKVAYHTGRSMLECREHLLRLLD
jgi:mannobiose 2-epimerase